MPDAGLDTWPNWRLELSYAVLYLTELMRRLPEGDEGYLDLDSQAGKTAAAAFLRGLDKFAHRMKVELVPRESRAHQSERVRRCWSEEHRLYSLQILQKCVHPSIFFNGRQFQLSKEAVALAVEVHSRWKYMAWLLRRLHSIKRQKLTESNMSELRWALTAFDRAWSAFEARFFFELTAVEAEARAVVVEAVDLLHQLDTLRAQAPDEQKLEGDSDFTRCRGLLVDCVTRLNQAAHPSHPTPRFRVEVLQKAEDMLHARRARDQAEPMPLLALAEDAVDAFSKLCEHLRSQRGRVDKLDPDLGSNSDLARLLAAWQASWELANKYVVNERNQRALSHLVSSIHNAREAAPALVGMCNECSAELFMALPRVVWLSILSEPKKLAPLVVQLLPHRIQRQPAQNESAVNCFDRDLYAFFEDFRRTWNQSAKAMLTGLKPRSQEAESLTSDVLSRLAVLGLCGGHEEIPACQRAQDACKSFMRTLEGWSMELQRHRAQEWNRFSATLMRCIEQR